MQCPKFGFPNTAVPTSSCISVGITELCTLTSIHCWFVPWLPLHRISSFSYKHTVVCDLTEKFQILETCLLKRTLSKNAWILPWKATVSFHSGEKANLYSALEKETYLSSCLVYKSFWNPNLKQKIYECLSSESVETEIFGELSPSQESFHLAFVL